MPTRSETSQFGECWSQRPRKERIVIGVITLSMVLVILMVAIFVAINSGEKICHSPICKSEAQKYLQRMDPSVDPCDNFYQFACGNFHHENGVMTEDVYNENERQWKKKLLDMYREDIHADDHKTVKVAKQLFKKCVDQAEIEKDNLQTIKSVLKELGGWPVVEGRKWDESKFDWVRAIYKLRQLGYTHSIFLDVTIEPDEVLNTTYIFKLNYRNVQSDANVTQMVQVAKIFGATEFDDELVNEMQDIYTYQQKLVYYDKYDWYHPTRVTINEHQQTYGSFDLLEFINNVVGPTAEITKDTFVLLPNQKALNTWVTLISSATKRTQANFMMFKVIEPQIPYLTRNLQNLFKKTNESRVELCLKEIEDKFVPSPIEIMCDRKYLPVEANKEIKEIVENIVSALIATLNDVEWLANNDKKISTQKLKNITYIIGQPGNYFDDAIFDNIGGNIIETETNSLLTLLAQATRNRQTQIYSQIRSSPIENIFERNYIKNNPGFLFYSPDDNVLFIPTAITAGFIFREGRPRYLNYPRAGKLVPTVLTYFLIDVNFGNGNYPRWSNQSIEMFNNKIKCIEEELKEYQPQLSNLDMMQFAVSAVVSEISADQISYAAYQKWTSNNGEEYKLNDLSYTPNQLFSIAATNCQALFKMQYLQYVIWDNTTFLEDIVYGVTRNSANFAKDFSCPIGSKMNPKKKCKIF